MQHLIRVHSWLPAVVIFGLSLCDAPLAAQPADPQQAAPAKVASAEGISEYRLANDLRVLLFPDASKPTITVNMTYLVGSRHENYGETGMAHLLEHMLFKGTPSRPNLPKDFNVRGVRFNGSTWLDRTNYFELFQANDDNLDWALRMEADRMVNSFVAAKDLETEMTVVRNEYERGENSPFSVLLKRMQSVAYDWHNYGNSTIGNRSDIENVEIRNLRAFYRRYYQPDNAVLLVAGKFDEAKTLGKIARYFGGIPKPKRALPKLWTVEPTQDGERQFFVRRAGDMQIVALGYKIPSALSADADALRFVDWILADSPSGRLHKALVETGKAADIASFQLLGVDSGLHFIAAVVKKGDPIEPVQAEMVRVIEMLHDAPPSAEELQRTRQTIANEAERMLNDHERIGVELSEYIALGDWRTFFLGRDRAQTVDAAAVQAVAKKYYRRDNRTVGLFLPEDQPQRAELPAPATVASLLKDFKPKQAAAAAEAFDPSPDNIDKRTKLLQVGGLRVALLQKKNRGEAVNVSLRLRSGDEKSLFGQRAVSQLTGAMLMRGAAKFTREQLKDEFEKLKIAGGVNGLGASFETTKPNLEAALRLAAHVLREPAFPPSEFEQLKKLTLTSIESQLNDPGSAAAAAVAQQFNIYPKGDWRYAPSLAESLNDVKAVTLEDIKRFHKAFYGADRGEIAVVGDFDEATVVQAIRETLADWKTGAPYAPIAMDFKAIAPTNRAIETPDKENAVFRARINIGLNEDDADFAPLYLANYMLGAGAGFDSRLTARIRVKEGLSYGVSSALAAGDIDRAGSWQAQAIAAPQNIARVEAAFKDEMRKALQDGFTAAEVAAAKSGVLQQRMQSRAQDRNLAGAWINNLYLNRTFAWSKRLDQRLAALTPDEILTALRKHIDLEQITIVKAGDFAKVKN